VGKFHDIRESRERLTLSQIALSFFGLAAFGIVDPVLVFIESGEASASPICLESATAGAEPSSRPALRWAEDKDGMMTSDSKASPMPQTLLCTYLSAGRLPANSLVGWSSADPIAGLS
jgi:hypothetical protein